MDDRYRLVFRGEVLDGQHQAVVQKRLAEALNLDAEKADTLFSGKTIVLKRDADTKTAARYQGIFKKAGGRLRILPVETSASEVQSGSGAVDSPPDRTTADPAIDQPVSPAAGTEFTVLSSYYPPPAAPKTEIQAPDFAIAERGSMLVEPESRAPVEIPDVDFDLAEPGVNLLERKAPPPVVELGPLDFELADVGADLGELRRPVTPVAPDISHLKLVDA